MTFTNPLEVLKLKAQFSPLSCSRYPHPSFMDMYNCACTKFHWRDTFKGLHLNLLQGLISAVMYMQVYESTRSQLINQYSLSSTSATLSSAFVARVLVTTLLVPVEAMRVRLTNSTKDKLITTDQQGFKVTMFRDLTYSCLLWVTIETIRNALVGSEYRANNKNQDFKTLLYSNMIPAFIAANLISIITTPIDTVKTRIQSGVELQGQSFWKQAADIYRKEGYTGLFAGVQYRAVKNSISSVTYISLYEYFIQRFSSRSEAV